MFRFSNAGLKSGKSMTIGGKIMAVVGFCLVMLTVVAITSIWQISRIGVEIDDISQRDIPLTAALTSVTILQHEQAIMVERGLRLGAEMQTRPASREAFEKSVEAFERLTAEIGHELAEAEKLIEGNIDRAADGAGRDEGEESLEALKKIHAEHVDFDRHAKEAFDLIASRQLEKVFTLIPKIEAEEQQLDQEVTAVMKEIESHTANAIKTMEEHEHFAEKLLWIVTIIAFAAGLSLAYLVVRRSISRPLKDVVDGLDALAAGDTSVDVKVYANDEIGKVAASFGNFREAMIRTREMEAEQQRQKQRAEEEKRAMTRQLADDFEHAVGGIVETVSSAATQMQSSAQTLSASSEQTSRQSAAVAAAAEEASTNVQTVSSAAEELSSSISEISRQVTESTRVADDAVGSIEATNVKVQGLKQAAEKIGAVVSLITDIAEQTNLLALNATIEAARAGDAGRGFAVVASEVKELASQTAKATEEIGSQIQGIQAATEDTVTAIEAIGGTIQGIKEISTAISAAVEEQGAATGEIASNIEQAATGTVEVTSNIVGVNEAASETGQSSRQLLDAASDLSRQSESLRMEVGNFLSRIRAA